MKDLQRIPLEKSGYINYEKGDKLIVYLIKLDNKGDKFKIQHSGVMCRQFEGKGILAGKFFSDSKYFDPDYWYKATPRFTRETIQEVLNEILKETNKKLKTNFSSESKIYDEDWFEALIFLSNGKEDFILTWMNCD